jgi:hypothetical protein
MFVVSQSDGLVATYSNLLMGWNPIR